MSSSHPSFVVIGAMKSGSTSLSNLLESCPEIFITKYKEPGFFSRDERYKTGIDKYLEMYEPAKHNQITGEASTCYSRKLEFPLAAERLYAHNPDCKLIYLMRDPVKRAYSDYSHRMAERIAKDNPQPTMPYSQALSELPEILDASNYYEQINHYLKIFPASSLHLMFIEDLIENTYEQASKLFEFLGVESSAKGLAFDRHNASGTKLANRRSKTIMGKIRAAVPGPIKRMLSDDFKASITGKLRAAMTKNHIDRSKQDLVKNVDPPSKDMDEMVYKKLELSILELEKMLGRDLSMWKR